MIVTCENCQKRYSIADDRVSGAKVKIRCRSCGHVTRCQPAKPKSRPRSNPDAWFAVLDGKQVGPLSEGKLRGEVTTQRITPDTFFWRRGMPQWQRARELPELLSLMPAPSTPSKSAGGRKQAEPAPVTAPEPEPAESAHLTDALSSFSMSNLTPRTMVLLGLLVGLSAILFWGMLGSRRPVVPVPVQPPADVNPATHHSKVRASPMANLLLGQKKEPSPHASSAAHRGLTVTVPKAEAAAELEQPRGEPAEPRPGVPSGIGSRMPKRPIDSARGSSESGLGEKEVARVVAQSQPAFQFCIEQELRKNPTFRGGKVFVTATVGSSGVVKAVEISRRDIELSRLGECLKSKAKRMVFPPFPGGETEVQVPLILTANLP